MSDPSLLPPNSTAQERAVEAALALPADMKPDGGVVMRPQDCPTALLPWLAWALSVDVWDAAWPDERKRAVIAQSVAIHRRKGTIGSIRRALVANGHADAVVIEGRTVNFRDGSILRDGTEVRGALAFWAEYRVYVQQALTIAQGATLRKILELIAPAGCTLAELNFSQVPYLRDGSVLRDGTRTRGVV